MTHPMPVRAQPRLLAAVFTHRLTTAERNSPLFHYLLGSSDPPGPRDLVPGFY